MLDLGERTLNYAVSVRKFVKSIKMDRLNQDDFVQLIRSSGSVGANYIEANESLSRRDFIYRIKICLKEAKESAYWLKVIRKSNSIQNNETLNSLILESGELVRIFSSIVKTSKNKE